MFRRFAVTVVVVLAMAGQSTATVNIWLSTSGTTSPGSSFPATATAVPTFAPYLGGSGSIFIWGRPDPGKSLINLSLNLVAETQPICTPDCVTPNAIAFTSATVFNPEFDTPTVTRFEYVDDSTTALPITANRVDGMTGLTIFENGAIPAVGIGSMMDPRYDASNNSWMIAQVDYDALATGENSQTWLNLQIGHIGLNHAGETTDDCYVVFGDATDESLNGLDDREMSSSNVDALIQPRVLPGDADRNGIVEPADYTIWRASFGSTTQLAADHNTNGTVDAGDYAIWRHNLGLAAGAASASGTMLAIPEPSAVVLALIAAAALITGGSLSFARAR